MRRFDSQFGRFAFLFAALSLFGATHSTAQAFSAASVTAPVITTQPITSRPATSRPIALKVFVQVLDGRTGKPLSGGTVRVECTAVSGDCPGISAFERSPQTRSGELALPVPTDATSLWIDVADEEHTFCSGLTPNATTFSVAAIRSTGVLAGNGCGHIPADVLRRWQPQPGRIVVFVGRRSWWRKLLPYC